MASRQSGKKDSPQPRQDESVLLQPGDTVTEMVELRIQELIGQGTYGTVFKAVQSGVERTVAIKQLQNAQASISTLKKEAWVNGGLIHPNIVSVLLFDENRGLIVMEYVPNSLKDKISAYNDRKQQFDEGQVVEILTQCLEALAHAYEHGCRFHGDVKPGNILITEEGSIKLGDFGVSVSYKTPPGELSGSETWAAPEVLRAWQRDRVWTGDQKSDLFALGVVAYILLTGTNPFVDQTGMRKPRDFILDPNYVPRVPVTTDPNIGRVVSKLLAKELAKRYQSAREALDDIYGISRQPPEEAIAEVPPKLVPSAAAGSPADLLSSEDLQRIAYDFNQHGDYESGEEYSSMAIAKDPKNLFAFQTRGFARSLMGEYPDAISDFTTAIQLCPKQNVTKLGQLYYHRAYAKRELGQMDSSCEDIRQALQYDPTNSKYQYLRARVCKEVALPSVTNQ